MTTPPPAAAPPWETTTVVATLITETEKATTNKKNRTSDDNGLHATSCSPSPCRAGNHLLPTAPAAVSSGPVMLRGTAAPPLNKPRRRRRRGMDEEFECLTCGRRFATFQALAGEDQEAAAVVKGGAGPRVLGVWAGLLHRPGTWRTHEEAPW